MLFPKKAKYRKWQRARKNPLKRLRPDARGISVDFGSYGLKAMSPGRVRSNQLEAARKTMVHSVSKAGKVWIRVFPDRPFTQKGAEVPMGKGKGEVQGYEVEVSPGRILFEIDGVTGAIAADALRKAGAKLPIKTKVVTRL